MENCSVKGCLSKSKCRGMCQVHYMRWWHHGDPNIYLLHNKTGSPEYRTWVSMLHRVYRQEHKNYKHYGARGITVCDKWRYSFKAFYADMGDKPFSKAQIDRIDNDGNYEPNNCHWVTPSENQHNKRNNALSWDQVRKMRQDYPTCGMSQPAFGRLFGVGQSTVSRVVNNIIWRTCTNG